MTKRKLRREMSCEGAIGLAFLKENWIPSLNPAQSSQRSLSASAPVDNNSTFEPKAVLLVATADWWAAAIAKVGVEVFGLNEAQRDFFAHLNVKSATYGQSESGCRKRRIARAKIRNVVVASET